ncbi:MAG: oxidoreductase, partial [Chloroflexi bacterium]|nr:oxidoreductase [Chloroflexota bacterium]
AKLKFEFLAQYYKVHRIPLRSRIFGAIHIISRIAAGPLAPIINAVMASKPMRILLEKTVGISSKRVMPAFSKEPFTKWFEKRKALTTKDTKKHKGLNFVSLRALRGRKKQWDQKDKKHKIVLFNDTFNTYNNPEVAISATEVFEAAGFEVVLPGHKCCGRPAISKGLVDQARKLAQDTVERLYPFAEQGVPIVGLEPSCLLSMRDEYHYLLPDNPKVKVVSELCYTFEEFIAKMDAEGKWHLPLKTPASNVILHGHCQQKAISGIQPSAHILNLLPNADVETLDTGCCGMAGSFGYEAEHYDISMKMGEDRLLPAARNADVEALIVAAGTSCRHQIADGAGRKALHPAEVLRRAVRE